MKILFELAFKRKIVTSLLKYNCLDYFFQVLFVNIFMWILLLIWTLSLLWIFLSISATLKYYNTRVKWEAKINGIDHESFFEKLLDHEIFSSMVPWATKYFLKKLKNPPAPTPPSSPLLHTKCTLLNWMFTFPQNLQ